MGDGNERNQDEKNQWRSNTVDIEDVSTVVVHIVKETVKEENLHQRESTQCTIIVIDTKLKHNGSKRKIENIDAAIIATWQVTL